MWRGVLLILFVECLLVGAGCGRSESDPPATSNGEPPRPVLVDPSDDDESSNTESASEVPADLLDLVSASSMAAATIDLGRIRSSRIGIRLTEESAFEAFDQLLGIDLGHVEKLLILFEQIEDRIEPILIVRTDEACEEKTSIDVDRLGQWMNLIAGDASTDDWKITQLDSITSIVSRSGRAASIRTTEGNPSQLADTLRSLSESSEVVFAIKAGDSSQQVLFNRVQSVLDVEDSFPPPSTLDAVTARLAIEGDPLFEFSLQIADPAASEQWSAVVQTVLEQLIQQFENLQQQALIHPDDLVTVAQAEIFEQLLFGMEQSDDQDAISITVRRPEEIASLLSSVVATLSGGQPASDLTDEERLESIGQAVLEFDAAHGILPPWASTDDEGHPLLSWRVHLLPFLGYDSLYAQFDLEAAWDSPENHALLGEMPPVFASSGLHREEGKTTVFVFAGEESPFSTLEQFSLERIDDGDGRATTILAVIVSADRAAAWTRPTDLEIDELDLVELLQQGPATGLPAVMMDGHCLEIPIDLPEDEMRSLITPEGEEEVDLRRLSIPDR